MLIAHDKSTWAHTPSLLYQYSTKGNECPLLSISLPSSLPWLSLNYQNTVVCFFLLSRLIVLPAGLYIISICSPLVLQSVRVMAMTYRLHKVKDMLLWTNSMHCFLLEAAAECFWFPYPAPILSFSRLQGLELAETEKVKQERESERHGKGDLWARGWKPQVVWGPQETGHRIGVGGLGGQTRGWWKPGTTQKAPCSQHLFWWCCWAPTLNLKIAEPGSFVVSARGTAVWGLAVFLLGLDKRAEGRWACVGTC